jgi:type IV pilus assembly protein PilV
MIGNSPTMRNPKRLSGFTLIEVLISLVVLAIGLLGLAALQAEGLKNNQNAYARSQATQLAYDLADRIRANLAAKSSYTTIDPSTATTVASCTTTAGCNAAQMAQNDLYEWYSALTDALPLGVGTIAVDASGKIYTVSVRWDEDHDGNLDHVFQTSFEL